MAQRSRAVWQVLAAVVAAAVLGGTVFAFATVRVCDQEVTNAGTVVSVCRHLQATDPPMVAAGLVLLVALGTFFTEISGFGISLKREVQEVRRTAEEAHEEASEAKVATKAFEETASDLAEGVQRALTMGRPRPGEQPGERTLNQLDALAEEYNHVRWTMPAGHERTSVMTGLMRKMIEHAKNLSNLDVESYLRMSDAGQRLAAYAYLYAHPDPSWAPALAEAALKDDKPFNQYWALRALEAQRTPITKSLDRDLIRRLRARLPELRGDASRYELLARLLDVEP